MARHILVLVALTLVMGGCASKRVRQPPDMSGFLDDYSLLREGGPNDVRFVYRNPKANWTAYDKILLEPVTLWRSGKGSLDPMPEEDLARLVNDFEAALRARLGERFRFVETPGPGVMRIRMAITEARSADPTLDVLTARGEAGGAAGPDGPLHAETRRFVERADIEGEIQDAQTGELLAQGLDSRRRGAAALPLTTWAEVDRALAFWADRLCTRLEERAGR